MSPQLPQNQLELWGNKEYNVSRMIKTKIISDPNILSGKPVISGTRISVELIMNFLASGMSVDEILSDYTELKKEEILAAIDYAAKLVSKSKFKKMDSNEDNFSLPSSQ